MKPAATFLTLLSLVLSSWLQVSHAQTPLQQEDAFWSDFPPCSLQCHEDNFAASGCPLSDSCLCVTVPWLYAVAECIGWACGPTELDEAAQITNAGCASNGVFMAISEQQYIAAGTPDSTTDNTPPSPTSARGGSTTVSSE